MLTAAVDHPGHLTVDGIEAQPFVPVLLLFAWCFGRQWELQRLQQAGLIVIQVCDGVHWHATLDVIGNVGLIQVQLPYNLYILQNSVSLTLLRARGAASGVLGDDSLAVSDVELKEELLLDSSLLDDRFVANYRIDGILV